MAMDVIITRRAALRGMGAATAAAGVMGGAVLAVAAEHPDAELIRLGDEFEAVFGEWCAQFPAYRAALEALKAKLQGLRGDAWIEGYGKLFDGPDFRPYQDRNEALLDRKDELVARIRALPAVTVHGLVSKAKVLLSGSLSVEHALHTHEPSEELELDHELVLELINESSRLAAAA